MVKGVSRHAVIVRSPDLKDFEQAIFIVSGQNGDAKLKSPDEMLKLACSLASDYCASAAPGRKIDKVLSPLAWFCGGGAAASLVWWAISYFAFI